MRERLEEMLWLTEEFMHLLGNDFVESYSDEERLSLRILVDFLVVENLVVCAPGESPYPSPNEIFKEIKSSCDLGCILACLAEKAFRFRLEFKKGKLSDAERRRLTPNLEEYEIRIEQSQNAIYELFGSEAPDLYIEKGWDKQKEVW